MRTGRSRTPGRKGTGGRRREPRRAPAEAGAVFAAMVEDQDADGEVFVRRAGAPEAELFRLVPEPRGGAGAAPGLGDRVLVRIVEREEGALEAQLIRRLETPERRVLAVVRRRRGDLLAEPVGRKDKDVFVLEVTPGATPRDGDLVLVQPLADARRRIAARRARIVEVVGREDQPRAASLIALHAHAIPTGFSPDAEAEASAARPVGLEGREDLRGLPFVTIDPQDARDHDDAVFARRDGEGWTVVVAIADVAAFVRSGSPLDREAWVKGNSVYFPDRVEPMLPEALSAGLCSLSQNEDRAVLAAEMRFGPDGRRTGARFRRALIRSRADLSYETAQAVFDRLGGAVGAAPDPGGSPGVEGPRRPKPVPATAPETGRASAEAVGEEVRAALADLWGAYQALARARDAREPLEIDSPERRIVLDADGRVVSISPRERLEAHRLIEEMMIQANVTAAEALESRRAPLIYRVHEPPSEMKLLALRDFLATVGLSWSKGEPPRPDRFNRLLRAAAAGLHGEIVNEVVLRTQSQARYDVENLGHFGLNLGRYAHFTSPIRRYADLVVHRALIRALGLGADGQTDAEALRLSTTAEHVTATERAAMAAERDATDRYLAAYLEDRVGAEFSGRITGVTRFGLFVRLDETGADGLAPINSLGEEWFEHDERAHALVGSRTGRVWRLGARTRVRLKEAAPLTGGLLLEMVGEPEAADPAFRPRRGARGGAGPARTGRGRTGPRSSRGGRP